MAKVKVVVLAASNGGFRVDFESNSWEEALGWAKGRCTSSGSPFLVLEKLGEENFGRVIAFYRGEDFKPVEWNFWGK